MASLSSIEQQPQTSQQSEYWPLGKRPHEGPIGDFVPAVLFHLAQRAEQFWKDNPELYRTLSERPEKESEL